MFASGTTNRMGTVALTFRPDPPRRKLRSDGNLAREGLHSTCHGILGHLQGFLKLDAHDL